MINSDWDVYYFAYFDKLLDALIAQVEELSKKDPDNYKSHPKAKLLAQVRYNIGFHIPSDPTRAEFRQGKTLGQLHTDWRRSKTKLTDRYRIFFKFSSDANAIVIAWMNDENTLRKEGASTDCYKVFRAFLDSGKVPSEISELISQSSPQKSQSQ